MFIYQTLVKKLSTNHFKDVMNLALKLKTTATKNFTYNILNQFTNITQ